MYPLSEHRPDCRVFFKRLITPDPQAKKKITEGMPHMSAVEGFAFNSYAPSTFKPQLIDKYKKQYGASVVSIEKAIEEENIAIKDLKTQIKNIESQLKSTPNDVALTFPLRQELMKANDELAFQEKELKNHNDAKAVVRPLFEPFLLELIIGLVSVNTTVNRDGVGTASITIKLPLLENGFADAVLYATLNDEMFNKMSLQDKVVQYTQSQSTKSILGNISSRELSIFKLIKAKDGTVYTDRRECALLLNDMVQIYFTNRYADDKSKTTVGIPHFPQDYTPGFTGFIKSTTVAYSSGQNPSYTVTINCEDIANPLRISRANLDPSANPQYRPDGTLVSAFSSKIAGAENLTGTEIIKSLIIGKEGFWGGVSQIEVTTDVGYDEATHQFTQERKTYNVDMPWEFDRIPLNIYTDLINIWAPYVGTFKQAWKLWESDYKLRWDVCADIASIMEFEFYADNLGAINYHPPLYNVNPINMQFFIEDKDILSEQHNMTDSGLTTAVEIVSQPQWNVPANIAKNLSAFAIADDEWIQRYGMRFRSKTIPILGSSDRAYQADSTQQLNETRYLFARAWLNRRNLEAQTASVEIPGTPEYCLCNSVAFVGDFGDFATKLMLPIGAKEMLDNIKVYYISGISHKYTQGGSFTTTLRLTHGRLWGKHFMVGWAFNETENDQLIENMKKMVLNRKESDEATARSSASSLWNASAINKTPFSSTMDSGLYSGLLKINKKDIQPATKSIKKTVSQNVIDSANKKYSGAVAG